MKGVKYYILICAAILTGCREWGIPPFESDPTLPNADIGYLRSSWNGSTLTIADDIVIAGRVVSSDKAGNFYNTFFIDDGTGAVEIMAGMPDLHASYHEGQKVIVRAKGLGIGWGNGVMQLGRPHEPGSGFATGYFYHPVVMRRYVSRDRDTQTVAPIETDIASLSEDMCGQLVRIAGLTPDPDETALTWAVTEPKPATGYRKFYTAGRADSITVVTSGYAHFAARRLPGEEVALTGILLYGKGGSTKNHFLLKPRYETDITD